MKRILITGSNGLLGQKVVELLSNSSNFTLLLTSKHESSVFHDESLTYRTLDTSHKQDVQKAFEEFEPEIIIHTAAMTNVDQCELEREAAWHANVTSVENVVHASKLVGARIIHLSTDYVFDGKNGPYDEQARPNPLSYYGRTKLASENVIASSGLRATILRTMILYGMAHGVKMNFALWLLKSLSEEKPVRIVSDQIGNPTFVDDLAYAILKVVELDRTGLFHIAGPDLISRYDFALALAKTFGFNKKLITPITTASLNQPAPRPLKSGFITLKLQTSLDLKMSDTQHGLVVLKNQLDTNMKDFVQEQPS